MHIAVLANTDQQAIFLQKKIPQTLQITWADTLKTFLLTPSADAYIDMAFRAETARTAQLKKVLPSPVFINAVIPTCAETNNAFIRFNGWPSFLERPITEIAAATAHHNTIKKVFHALQWPYLLAPDIPGMISARVIATIINEAYFTLAAGISTAAEIDIAMKLGTHYPLGPFEWCQQIGLENIYNLLTRMEQDNERYKIAPNLQAAAGY